MAETSRRETEEKLLTAICRRPDMALSQIELLNFSENELSHTNRHRSIFRTILKLFKKDIYPTASDLLELLISPKQSQKGEKRLSKTISAIFDPDVWPELAPDARQVRSLVTDLRDIILRQAVRRQLLVMLDQTRKPSSSHYRDNLVQGIGKLGQLLTGRPHHRLDDQVKAMKQQSIKSLRNKHGITGLDSGFPLFSQYLSGIQNEFYIVAGSAGIGKSTFLTQLAWQLPTLNHGTRVLFFSLDQKYLDITAKLVSLAGEIPVTYVKNPSVSNIPNEKKRRQGIELVSQMRDWLEIIDESSGAISLDDVLETVAGVRLEHTGPLVVLIDPITKLEMDPATGNLDEKMLLLVSRLKTLTASHQVSVIVTCELNAEAEGKRPTRYHLPPCPAFLEHSYATILLYCDYINNYETSFIEWEWDSKDLMVPISEINIIKNKMGEYRGRIFFRFYNSLSRYRECVHVENENYQAMINNIENYEVKTGTTGPDSLTAPISD